MTLGTLPRVTTTLTPTASMAPELGELGGDKKNSWYLDIPMRDVDRV